MSFNQAITSGQYTKLRSKHPSGGSDYQVDYLVTICSNTVVFAGQVNTDLSIQNSWAQFNWNNATVGAYTDVKLDQVLLISPVNDITKATYRGRIREFLPTATVIYCMESSLNFAVGAYFWVLDVYEPQYILSRPDDNGNELVNYDQTYLPPRAKVRGLRTAYINYVDPSTNKMRVAFDVSTSYAVASGDSISSYLFTFVGGTYSVVSGSLSSAVVTVDFNADTEQWGKLEVTTANGQVFKRMFKVKALGTTTQPDASFKHPPITGDWERGWSMNISAFANADDILNRSMFVVWRYNESYGGVSGGLDAYNVYFVGWLQKEDDPVTTDQNYSVTSEANFEVLGLGPIMGLLTAQMLPFVLKSSPSSWGEIKNLTWWRAIAHFLDRYTTIAMLVDIDFSDLSDAFLFADIPCTGGNVLSAVTEIGNQVNALVEYAPDGRLAFNRRAEQVTNLEQASLTIVANWEAQDCIEITKSFDQNRKCGVVDADGATYITSTGQTNFYTARAPGHAMGEAQGRETLNNQILPVNNTGALVELRQRAGNHYNISNNNEVLHVKHPDGYAPIFTPSKRQFFTFTIDNTLAGAQGVNRIKYTTSDLWLLESVSLVTGENGTAEVQADYRKLIAVGDLGDNTTLTAPGEIPISIPDIGIPAFDWEIPELTFPDLGLDITAVNPAQLNPPPGTIAATNGDNVLAATASNVYWLRNFIILKIPRAIDITPSDLGSYTVRAIAIDPFFTTSAVPAYVLASDGTNSAVWYNPNVAAGSAAANWTKGANLTGIYTVLRATNVAGTVMVYSPYAPGVGTSTGTYTVTFDAGGYGNYSFPNDWANVGTTAIASGGNPNNCAHAGPNFAGAGQTVGVQVRITLPTPLTITQVTFDADKIQGNNSAPGHQVVLYNASMTQLALYQPNGWVTNNTWYANNTGAISVANVKYIEIRVGNTFQNATVEFAVDNIAIHYSGLPNVAAGYVTTSTDDGLTWGTPRIIGATALPFGSSGGFDVQRVGANSFAAGDGVIYRATTLGGTYSSYYTITGGVQSACIIVPYFNWAGTKQTTSANPDIIVALTDVDGSSRSLLWIEGGATPGTVHNLTPVAGMQFDNANCVTIAYNHHIAVFGKVSGVYKLYTTTNKGSAWTNRGTLSSPQFLRDRRNDTRAKTSGTNAGQLYLASDSDMSYSSKWASGGGSDAGLFPRTMPSTPIVAFDILG